MRIFAGLLLAGALVGGCAGSSAPARLDSPYTAFANPQPVVVVGYSGDAMEPFVSKDGNYLFFNSRNDPSVNTDLYYASRVDDQTFTFLG